ncbi:MAG TPA: A/G-specific adenine glycosylase [Thermoanaerobaculia bacterium]|nr:A/G-specific adenine glycosylase [Thermoanaerobaculia bacterium]
MTGDPRLRASLLAWFDREKRELPWRGTRDPWAIWVSEVMLQQTTVQTVLPRYPKFLKRFPTVETLARARLDTVLAAWSGLGYYARARNLHRAARTVVEEHGGKIPEDPEVLRGLPGIGAYMAQALSAIAFGRPALPVEANVRRVVSRIEAADVTPEAVARLVSRKRPGDSIAALFDLGQIVCRPRNPACGACPLARSCRARARGIVDRFPPRRTARPARPLYRCVAAAVSENGRILVRRRADGFLAGMWELPGVEADVLSVARARFRSRFRAAGRALLGTVEQPIAGKRVRVEIYSTPAPASRPGDRWMTAAEIEASASPSLTKKIARRVSPAPRERRRIGR